MNNDFNKMQTAGEKLLHRMNLLHHIELGFDRKTIVWFDAYISTNRDSFSEDEMAELPFSIGYILGETIVVELRGTWVFDEGAQQWLVEVGSIRANPISKVQKYLTSYLDSIVGFFSILEMTTENSGLDLIENDDSEA
jgi:hypothetical protein